MKKKDKYNQRVIEIEKSSFNPLVFTSGVMALECTKVNKSLAEKHREPYASILTYIRIKLRLYF